MFLSMLTRYAFDEIPYAERHRQYLKHLRYWNHLIEEKKIDLLVLNHVPHQGYDLVMYDLCRLKGIPTLYIDRCHVCGLALLPNHWEDPARDVRETMDRLREEHRDTSITLSPLLQNYYESQTLRDESPWYMFPRHTYLLEKNFIRKWSGKALKFLVHKPSAFLSLVTSTKFWKRKIREHRTIGYYDSHVSEPDFTQPFIYVPLHMQPEATTCPMGGGFMDQELMVKMLAWHLPAGVKIYVKEHPHQGEQMRSQSFYDSMIRLPSVIFVPRDTSTVRLTESAVATATVTGTAGFECVFREKPVFLFGHVFYQDIPGVFQIRSHADCAKAMDAVFAKNAKPTLQDVRLFLKAMDICGTTFEAAILAPGETCPMEEQIEHLGTKLTAKILELQRS